MRLVLEGGSGFKRTAVDCLSPCPTIMATGIGGVWLGQYWIEDDGMDGPRDETDKPPYRVPSMPEIEAVPWNGFDVVSTFSGAGGSCLGYRMAGYRVLWAGEFVPAARATYRANSPATILDGRDVRQVKGSEVLAAIGREVGGVDLLDGSPPCASFSTAGKRQAGWNKVKDYSDTKQRTDDLFFEYARLVGEIRPKTFVAENVSGLVKGAAKGYFLNILAALKGCGYRVKAKVLDAQWLGVPQVRRRLIFVGVREDLGLDPAFPSPLSHRYSIRDAIPWIGDLESFPYEGGEAYKIGPGAHEKPAPTVATDPCHSSWVRHVVTVVGGPPPVERETDVSRYAVGRELDRLGPGESSGRYFNLARPDAGKPCPTITAAAAGTSAAGVVRPVEKRRLSITELKRICAFPDDFVLRGTYEQRWERLGRAVPPLMMKAVAEVVRDRILVPSRGGPCAG